jgi:uncharacterized protein (TIGR03000 family)
MHKMFGKVLAGAVTTLALLAWTSQADAFGHRWHGSGGGWGGSGGSWGGSSGGWGGSSGGWGGSSGGWGGGSSGGWGGGHHGGWHHKRHRGYGSSGGWGSWGGGSSGGWGGSSGGSSGGWGSSGGGGSYYMPMDGGVIDPSTLPPGSTIPPAGTVPPAGGAVPPAAVPPAAVPPAGTPTSNDGLLAVSVPEDAKIYVNGQPTTSTGGQRQYVSRNLKDGFNYSYEVRAEVVRDGKTVEQLKKVNVRAGETASLAFDFPADAETSLTVHVPADAKVYLAGNATKASGEKRVFRTTGLTGGKAWEGYTVRVELERGGRTLTKEETISLKAGESRELRFEFEGDKVASAR